MKNLKPLFVGAIVLGAVLAALHTDTVAQYVERARYVMTDTNNNVNSHADLTLQTGESLAAAHAAGTGAIARLDIAEPLLAELDEALDPLSEIETPTMYKLHVLEYPQQSNGKGSGTPAFYPTNFLTSVNTKSYLNMYSWVDGTITNDSTYLGVNKIFVGGWGAEIGSALAVDELANVQEYYYTRVMRGGNPLDSFVKGTAMYSNMLDRIYMTQTNWASAGPPDVLVWGQNESGSTAGTYEDYRDKALQLISDLRTDLSNANLRVVFQGRNAHAYDANWTNNVDKAMMDIAAADPLVTYMSQRQFETGVDVHYTHHGQAGRGRATGNAVVGILRGLKMVKGFRTLEAWVDRLGATVASIGELRTGNAKVDGKLTAGEAVIGGVTISTAGNISTPGSISGVVASTAMAIPPEKVSLFLPFRRGSLADPTSGNLATNVSAVGLAYSSLSRGTVASFAAASSNYFSVAPIAMSTNITVSWWIKKLNQDATYAVIGKDDSTSTFSISLHSASNYMVARFRDTAGVSETFTSYFGSGSISGGVWDNGEWHHMALVISGDSFQGYINGVLSSGTQTPPNNPGAANRAQCIVNAVGAGLTGAYFYNNAEMDDILVMNDHAATADEILAIYNRQRYGDSNVQGFR